MNGNFRATGLPSYKQNAPPPLTIPAQPPPQFIPAGILPPFDHSMAAAQLRSMSTINPPSMDFLQQLALQQQHQAYRKASEYIVPVMDRHQAANLTSHRHIPKDDLLQLMSAINAAVKKSEFTPNLANQIFTLCNELKNGQGAVMEQLHKEELGRVFVSLRQACCRDSGQLGTPCRLKIMELVELKAMGWRTSLAHSQYYLTRNGTLTTSSTVTTMAGNEDIGSPISAPPYGNIPVNPFSVPPGMLPPDLSQYFLMQAANSNGFPMLPSGQRVPQGVYPQNGTPSTPLSAQTATLGSLSVPHLPLAHSPGALSTGSGSGSTCGDFPRGLAFKSSGQRPQKVSGKNQYRDEIVIRNSDSGKVMGIKGRRISSIEEMSHTVVSFQKVAPHSKERVLTITGAEEPQIEHAKALIQQTIQRNASPCREEEENKSESTVDEPADILAGLAANDPKLLEVAKEALKEYFERHTELRRSLADLSVDDKKERRKSLPPIQGGPPPKADTDRNWRSGSESEDGAVPIRKSASAPSAPPHSRTRYTSTQSMNQVPEENEDIQHGGGGDAGGDGVAVDNTGGVSVQTSPSATGLLQVRVVYTREFLLQCSLSPMAKVPPAEMAQAALDNEDVLRELPGRFDPADYKNVCEQLKTLQVQLFNARQTNPIPTPTTGGYISTDEAFPFPPVVFQSVQ